MLLFPSCNHTLAPFIYFPVAAPLRELQVYHHARSPPCAPGNKWSIYVSWIMEQWDLQQDMLWKESYIIPPVIRLSFSSSEEGLNVNTLADVHGRKLRRSHTAVQICSMHGNDGWMWWPVSNSPIRRWGGEDTRYFEQARKLEKQSQLLWVSSDNYCHNI